MAMTATTLSSAVATGDLTIAVASASGSAVKNVVQIDNEFMTQTAAAVNTTLEVRRGEQCSYNEPHNVGALVLMGLASDFPAAPPGSACPVPYAPQWTTASYAVPAEILVPTTKQNVFVQLWGDGADAMTMDAPTLAQEGQEMLIQAQTAQAFTLTSAFNAGGGGADVATFGGAVGDNIHVKAVNLLWKVINLNGVTIA